MTIYQNKIFGNFLWIFKVKMIFILKGNRMKLTEIVKEFNPTKNKRAIKIELTVQQYQQLKKAIKSNLKNIEI